MAISKKRLRKRSKRKKSKRKSTRKGRGKSKTKSREKSSKRKKSKRKSTRKGRGKSKTKSRRKRKASRKDGNPVWRDPSDWKALRDASEEHRKRNPNEAQARDIALAMERRKLEAAFQEQGDESDRRAQAMERLTKLK